MSLTNDHMWFNDNVEIVEMCVCGNGGGGGRYLTHMHMTGNFLTCI